MPINSRDKRYEQMVLPHIEAAYNLARWLTSDSHDAEDVAQDAAIRAYRAIDDCRGVSPKAWLLGIVRNTAYTFLQKRRKQMETVTSLDNVGHTPAATGDPAGETMRRIDADEIRHALEQLPSEHREILVLREMEGLSYKEIAEAAGIPIGTVMSRLARARQMLRERLGGESAGVEGQQLEL